MSLIRDGKPLRVVHTRKNTSLEDWKTMVAALASKDGVDLSKVSALSYKHAWEGEDTPVSFVAMIKLMNDRAERSRILKGYRPKET